MKADSDSNSDSAIRTARPADAGAILTIEHASFDNHGERFGLRQIRSLIGNANGEVLVAMRGPNVVGWGAGLVRKAGRHVIGRVYAVAVLPDARGLRLGRGLMERIIRRLQKRGAVRIFLEVRADNGPAIGLYRKLGFSHRHVRHDYYGPGLHALSMVLDE